MADATLTQKQTRSILQVILSSGFLASLSTALVLYINSSFLETLVPKDSVGILFAIAYALTFVMMQNYSRLIARLRNYIVLLYALAIEIVALILLAVNPHPWVSIAAFIAFIVLYNSVVINFDILLEVFSKDTETGRIRGMFWTAANLGIFIGPFFSGFIADSMGFSAAYFAAAATLLPAWLLIFFTYRHSRPNHYKPYAPLFKTIKKVHANTDLRGIYLIAFMLFFFYSWMVIYTPIYLLDSGFTWGQIGEIFTIMLLPFILIEYPAGWLADKYLGETEMLTLGFSIMGLSVLALPFVSGFWAVLLILFLSRVGAALVEIMRDTYFYKKVDEEDLDLIDLFRNMRSVAHVVGPLLGSIILAAGFPLSYLFLVLGVILLISTVLPSTIKDTL